MWGEMTLQPFLHSGGIVLDGVPSEPNLLILDVEMYRHPGMGIETSRNDSTKLQMMALMRSRLQGRNGLNETRNPSMLSFKFSTFHPTDSAILFKS